ncbi:MAG: DUF368 domain-containing protein [Huintestinicola sp.]
MKKIVTFFHGFCMALADSVPGISGGTVAFLLGFYDKFIHSLGDLISGPNDKRKQSLGYLIKLGIGWVIGFMGAVIILSRVFEQHIYLVSSLFIGFIVFAMPIVIMEEKECLKKSLPAVLLVPVGAAIVAAITYFNPVAGEQTSISLDSPTFLTYLYVFFAGAIAICAMILPGISGSTLIMIFGLYMPIISGIRDVLSLDFHALPILIAFGLGILTGIISIIKLVQKCLDKFRGASIYLILGLMVGSLYAIAMGPQTLDVPQPPMDLSSFSILFFIIGAAIIVGMQLSKKYMEKKSQGTE